MKKKNTERKKSYWQADKRINYMTIGDVSSISVEKNANGLADL